MKRFPLSQSESLIRLILTCSLEQLPFFLEIMKPVITLGGFIIGDESFFNPSREVNNIFIVPFRRSAPRGYIYLVCCCCLLWILECKRKGRVGDKGLPPFQFENLGRGNFSAGGSRAALRRLVSSPQGILLRRISSHSVSPFLNIDLGSSESNILCMHTGYFGKNGWYTVLEAK